MESVRVAKKELSEWPKFEKRNSKIGELDGPWDGKECVSCWKEKSNELP